MEVYLSFGAIVTAAVFMTLGLLVFAVLLKPFVLMYLKAFRVEIIEDRNVAFAVLIGFLSLSLAIIIASAIH